MNPPIKMGLTAVFALVALVAVVGMANQRRELAGLRVRADRVAVEAREASARAAVTAMATAGAERSAPSSVPAASTGAGAVLTAEERVELMQLRSRVTDLRARQRALAGLSNETVALQAKLISVSNFARGQMGPGYVRRAAARNRGQATPEAALETFLWAIEHRDVEVLFGLIPTDEAEVMRRMFAAKGADAIFAGMPPFPGYRVTGRKEAGPDDVTLLTEFGPGKPPPIRFTREGGIWRMRM